MADCLIKGVFQSCNIDMPPISSFAANFFVANLQSDELKELKDFLTQNSKDNLLQAIEEAESRKDV